MKRFKQWFHNCIFHTYGVPCQTSTDIMVSWYCIHFSQTVTNSVEVILVQNMERVRGENYTTKYYGRWKISSLALHARSTIPMTSQLTHVKYTVCSTGFSKSLVAYTVHLSP